MPNDQYEEEALPFATIGTDAAIAAVYPALALIRVVMEEGEDGRMKKTQGSGSGAAGAGTGAGYGTGWYGWPSTG